MFRAYKIRKQLIIITFLALCSKGIHGQIVLVKSATSQGWAGGICCVHGINYKIQLTLIQSKLPITLDSLWIEGEPRDLSKYNQHKLKSEDTVEISILENLHFDDRITQNPIEEITIYQKAKPGIWLYYHFGTTRKTLNITHQMQELEFLAYP